MILITGASGTVGSEVLKQALATGANIRALYRDPKSAAAAPAKAEAAIGDYAKIDEIRAALRGVDRLFLICAPVPNLAELETNVIEAAKHSSVKHIVALSVVGAETGAHAFAKPHQKVERKLKASGIAHTILRANGFMQNFLQFADGIKNQGAFYSAGEKAKASFVDVRDIAAVAVKSLLSANESKSYEITGPEALSYGDVAQKFSRALGRDIKYVPLTPEEQHAAMLNTGIPQYIADSILDLQRFYDAGHAARVSPDVERVTGRKPISFEQFVRDYASVFQPGVAAAS